MADNTPETVEFTLSAGEGAEPTKVTIPRQMLLDAVKETHVPKANIEADFGRRFKSMIEKQGYRKAEELIDNEEFVGQVATKHGLKKAGEADASTAAQIRDKVAAAVAEARDKEVKPLMERLNKADQRELQARKRDLERTLVQAGTGIVRDSLLKSPGRGKPAPIVAILGTDFAYDEESGEHYAVKSFNDDGTPNFEYSLDDKSTYMTVEQRVQRWIEAPENRDFARGGQTGPNAEGGRRGSRSQGGEVWLTQEEAGNHATYEAALDKVGGDESKVKIKGLVYPTS